MTVNHCGEGRSRRVELDRRLQRKDGYAVGRVHSMILRARRQDFCKLDLRIITLDRQNFVGALLVCRQ